MEETADKNKEYEEMVKKYKIAIEKEKEKEKKTIENMLKYKEDLMKMMASKEEDKKIKKKRNYGRRKKIKTKSRRIF